MKICVGELRLGLRERKYLDRVIGSSRLSYGVMTREFERRFAKEHDCKYAVFCNSGTSALQIALAVLKEKYGWKDGDEVLVPSITFVATVNIVLHNNMKPVLVDVDPRTYNINPGLIKARITQKTRAIIPVHMFGLPADMDKICLIAKEYNLKIIEDSCETVFANFKGKKVGSFGEIGCFSTYVAHYIVTGVGGFATTNDPDLAIRLRSLMNHGRDSIYMSIDDDDNAKNLHEIIQKRFKFISVGYSYRCTELEAAIGLGQMEQKAGITRKRKENARYLTEGLNDLFEHIHLPTIPDDREHMFMMYPIVLTKDVKVEMVNYLEDRGIETRDMMPITNQPVYKHLFNPKDYPIADWINRSGFYIGCHQYLTKKDLNYILDSIHGYYKPSRKSIMCVYPQSLQNNEQVHNRHMGGRDIDRQNATTNRPRIQKIAR